MRRGALLVMLLAAVLAPIRAPAQAPQKLVRVGVLSPFLGPDSKFFEALRHRLGELGWVEGRNVVFVYRETEDFDRLQAHAQEMVALKVDVIATAGRWQPTRGV